MIFVDWFAGFCLSAGDWCPRRLFVWAAFRRARWFRDQCRYFAANHPMAADAFRRLARCDLEAAVDRDSGQAVRAAALILELEQARAGS